MRRRTRRLLTGCLTLALLPVLWSFRPVRREAWQADYLVLRETLARSYANLGYARDHGVDLVALDARTRAELESARTERAARAALQRFIGAFGDPHLKIVTEPPRLLRRFTRSGDAAPRGTEEGAAACASLGYDDALSRGYSMPFENIAGFEAIGGDTATFRPALVRKAGSRAVGIVRIAKFSQRGSRGACEIAWKELALGDRACDEACAERLYHRAGELLAARLSAIMDDLERRGAAVVLVDLGGNGGGSEWVGMATLAVARRPVDAPRVALVDTTRRCDWTSIAARRCDNLATPVRDSIVPVATASAPTSDLLVLTDAGTASAAEYFVAMLRDARVALVIGTRTMGAGCGYANGGGEVRLPRTGTVLRVPNCARLRRDGSNEREGITPDIDAAGREAGWVLDTASALAGAAAGD